MQLNNRGFSMIQLMITVGIVSGLSAAIMQITNNTSKLKKRVLNKSEVSNIEYQISQSLSLVNNCNLNFKKNETPKLVDNKQLVVNRTLNGTTSIVPVLNTDTEKTKSGIIVGAMSLLLSKKDSTAIGETFSKYASRDLHGYAEISLEFGLNSPSNNKYKKIVSRAIPLYLNLDNNNKFQSCYASGFNDQLKDAIAKAIEKSCGYGMKFNDDIENPECIPEAAEKDIAICPEGQYIKDIKITDDGSGKIKYEHKCLPELCQDNEIGVWHNGKMSCVNCRPNELPVMTTEGMKCKSLTCEGSQGKMEYFAGIDNKGEKICKVLVNAKNSQCGENGFYMLQTDDPSGSITSKCCQDCPSSRNNICEGNLDDITADCNVRCTGKKLRKDMKYSEWSTCTYKSQSGSCSQTRRGKCDNFDSKGYPCCHSGQEVSIVTKQCFNGGWVFDDCPTDNLTTSFTIEPRCTKQCCDPRTKPAKKRCIPTTTSGRTLDECKSSGGILYKYNNKVYCRKSGHCRYLFSRRWSTVYRKHDSAYGAGRTSITCGSRRSTCSANAKMYWHTGPPPTCTYNDYVRRSWGKCKGKDPRTVTGALVESLCR